MLACSRTAYVKGERHLCRAAILTCSQCTTTVVTRACRYLAMTGWGAAMGWPRSQASQYAGTIFLSVTWDEVMSMHSGCGGRARDCGCARMGVIGAKSASGESPSSHMWRARAVGELVKAGIRVWSAIAGGAGFRAGVVQGQWVQGRWVQSSEQAWCRGGGRAGIVWGAAHVNSISKAASCACESHAVIGAGSLV